MISAINLKISTVYITSNIKQTIVAVLSVTFGISMYIFMNSFMTGVNDAQSTLAFSTLAHVRIYNDGPTDQTNLLKNTVKPSGLINLRNSKVIQYTEGIKDSKQIISYLESQPTITALASQVNINVFFINGTAKLNGFLSGIEVENEDRLYNVSSYLTQGQWKELKYRNDGVIVGKLLAENLALKINSNLNVMTAEGVSRNYKVIGIFETTIAGTDKTKAYLNITAARQLLSKNKDYVTDIQINIKNYNHAIEVAKSLSPVIPYEVESWQKSNGQLVAASSLRDIIAKAVSLTILIVAGFGIYNIMSMTVNQKIREIAILKAMGFSGRDVKEIFLTLAIVIGILGGLAGMVFGYFVAYTVNHIPFKIATLTTLPMAYSSTDYLLSFLFGLVTSFIAGYLPARKASSVDPVAIIRG